MFKTEKPRKKKQNCVKKENLISFNIEIKTHREKNPTVKYEKSCLRDYTNS